MVSGITDLELRKARSWYGIADAFRWRVARLAYKAKSRRDKLAIADAMRQPEASSRRDSWSRASQFWAEAITEDNDSLKVRTDAVNSFLAAANDLVDAGYPDIAREAVYEAQGFAQGYIDLEQRVEAWKVAFGR